MLLITATITPCFAQDKKSKMIEIQLRNDTTILVAPEGKLLPEGNATMFAVIGALDEPVIVIMVGDKVIKAKIEKICFESGKAYFGWFYTPYTEVDEIYINGASITLPK
jgi:hypothetical protein